MSDPSANRGRVPLLLLVGAELRDDLAGDAVVRAEQRAERRGRVAELEGELHVLAHGDAEAAVLLRQRVPEQPHLGGLGAQLLGDAVLVLDLLLERDDGFADEVAHGVPDLAEVFSVHVVIVAHVAAAGSRTRRCKLNGVKRLRSVVNALRPV